RRAVHHQVYERGIEHRVAGAEQRSGGDQGRGRGRGRQHDVAEGQRDQGRDQHAGAPELVGGPSQDEAARDRTAGHERKEPGGGAEAGGGGVHRQEGVHGGMAGGDDHQSEGGGDGVPTPQAPEAGASHRR